MVATKVEEVAIAGAEKVEGLVGGIVGGAADATEAAEASASDAVEAVADEAAKVVEAVPAVSIEAEVSLVKVKIPMLCTRSQSSNWK